MNYLYVESCLHQINVFKITNYEAYTTYLWVNAAWNAALPVRIKLSSVKSLSSNCSHMKLFVTWEGQSQLVRLYNNNRNEELIEITWIFNYNTEFNIVDTSFISIKYRLRYIFDTCTKFGVCVWTWNFLVHAVVLW
jgi:hypothetical protein